MAKNEEGRVRDLDTSTSAVDEENPFDGDGSQDVYKAPSTNIKGRGGMVPDVIFGEELRKEEAGLELLAENEQLSNKEGKRSSSQKRAGSRFDTESVPPPHRVPGAYGKPPGPGATVAVRPRRPKRNRRGTA